MKEYFSEKKNVVLWIIALIAMAMNVATPRLEAFDIHYYLLAGVHFFNGEMDCLRTPVYPVLLYALESLLGGSGMSIGVTIIQCFVFVISILSLQNIAKRVLNNQKIQYAILLIYSTAVAPGWCNELMTESLSISGTIILVDLILQYVTTKKISILLLLHMLLVLLVFLRPTFLLYLMVLPAFWIWRLFEERETKAYLCGLVLTLMCAGLFSYYCYQFENRFGKFASSITYICNDVYNLRRSGQWNIEDLKSMEYYDTLVEYDNAYDGTYDFLYSTIQHNPQRLRILDDACCRMKSLHQRELLRYRVSLVTDSFDKRLCSAVNTHSPLSLILFVFSLFFSMPLSLYYLIILSSILVCMYKIIKRERIPLEYTLLSAISFVHCLGVLLTAADGFERVMTPIYGLVLIMLGIIIEKSSLYLSVDDNSHNVLLSK